MVEDLEGSEAESEHENATNSDGSFSDDGFPSSAGRVRQETGNSRTALQGRRRSIGDGPRAALPGTCRRCIEARYLSDGSCSAREGRCDVRLWCSRTVGIQPAFTVQGDDESFDATSQRL